MEATVRHFATVAIVLSLAGCFGTGGGGIVPPSPGGEGPVSDFAAPTFFAPALLPELPRVVLQGEPSIAVGPDGALWVTAPAITADGTVLSTAGMSKRQVMVWRAEDGGASFKLFNDDKGQFAEDGSGIGDADIAVDSGGRAYVLGLGDGIPLYTSADRGSTWTTNLDISAKTAQDRQWIAAHDEGHAVASWIGADASVSSGIFFAQSLDGGKTWSAPKVIAKDPAVTGSIQMVDDRTFALAYLKTPNAGLAGRVEGELHALVTRDGGASWNDTELEHKLPPGPGLVWGASRPSFLFPTMTTDTVGNLYLAWSEYRSDGSTEIWWTRSLDGGASWLGAVPLTKSPNAVFPALAAGAPGRVALAYLATDAGGDPNRATGAWSVRVMTTVDASHAGDVVWEDALAASSVHVGSICPNGNNCNGGLDSTGDRTLLDFIDAVVTPSGRVVVSYTTDPVEGGKRPHIAVVIQDGGTLLR